MNVPLRQVAARFFPWTALVNRQTMRPDLMAGLLGAVLVLPQGIAFATLAGLPAQYGLYSAIVPCTVAAIFGSSLHVMSGPTNANSLALFAMIAPLAAAGSPQYIQLALAVTILVGIMQWLIGVLRVGSVANFISPAALHGFTSGAAVLIAVHALNDWLAIETPGAHGAAGTLVSLAQQLGEANPGAVAVGFVTLIVALFVRRWDKRKPFMLIGLLAGTVAAFGFNREAAAWHLEPIALVGAIPSPIPPFNVPDIDWRTLPELLGLAFALTIVALGQSISIAKAVAARSGQRIDANREFVGQGLSNIVGGLFSCYVSCGSLNRSMPNLEAGARTPMAGLFSSALLLVLVAISAPLLALIPMAAIAGLLVLVAWSLLELPRWKLLFARHRTEFGIAAATAVATVTIRLETAILLGTILSLVSYLYRTSKPAMRTLGFDSRAEDRRLVVIDGNSSPDALPECPQLKLLRMEGSVYFGALSHVTDRLHALRNGPRPPKRLLVMAKSMNFIDPSGAELWQREMDDRRAVGGDLYFHRPRPEVIQMWERTGFIERLGRDHIFPDKGTAIADIFRQLDFNICAKCTARIFRECKTAPNETGSPGAGLD